MISTDTVVPTNLSGPAEPLGYHLLGQVGDLVEPLSVDPHVRVKGVVTLDFTLW